MHNYGVILKKLRELNNYSLKTAAARIGKSVGWLSEVENNRGFSKLKESEFERIVNLFNGVRHREMFDWTYDCIAWDQETIIRVGALSDESIVMCTAVPYDKNFIMKILVIGGRQFLGRHLVQSLLTQGHQITLFNRGKTNSFLFPDLEVIQGDRQKDFHLFKARSWDVVIDTCGFFPKDVSQFAQSLEDKAAHYIFISSTSVYDQSIGGEELDESTPLADLNVDANNTGMETYGARKALCERAVDQYFKGRSTHVRPGLIVGPFDTTYRFPYWVDRISEGGTILAPGEAEAPLQFIDVRDLSEWICKLIHTRPIGEINAVGPNEKDLTLGRFFELAISVLNQKANLEWVPETFLREYKVGCWVYLPLWVYKGSQGFMRRSSAKARKLGLEYRPISETIRGTREWSKAASLEKLKSVTLPRDREKEILVEWATRQSTALVI